LRAGAGKPGGGRNAGRRGASPGRGVGGTALEEVRAFLEVGPRDAGTPGAERAATYLVERLRALGVAAEIQEFREPSPLGPETVFRNVLGRIPGRTDRIVLLGSHYDTKTGIPDFVGANDSGSSTGLLLELARAFAAAGTPELEIRFAFFDGEECRVEYGPADGFHGSRHLARTMEADGSLSNVAAMILLDMVGDRDLTLTVPRNSTPDWSPWRSRPRGPRACASGSALSLQYRRRPRAFFGRACRPST
jgi:glutaminyl-peptide cyclotransferase